MVWINFPSLNIFKGAFNSSFASISITVLFCFVCFLFFCCCCCGGCFLLTVLTISTMVFGSALPSINVNQQLGHHCSGSTDQIMMMQNVSAFSSVQVLILLLSLLVKPNDKYVPLSNFHFLSILFGVQWNNMGHLYIYNLENCVHHSDRSSDHKNTIYFLMCNIFYISTKLLNAALNITEHCILFCSFQTVLLCETEVLLNNIMSRQVKTSSTTVWLQLHSLCPGLCWGLATACGFLSNQQLLFTVNMKRKITLS